MNYDKSWARNYLIKSALEKQAKRWFWRLLELSKKRRLRALERLKKHPTFGSVESPESMTLSDFLMGFVPPRPSSSLMPHPLMGKLKPETYHRHAKRLAQMYGTKRAIPEELHGRVSGHLALPRVTQLIPAGPAVPASTLPAFHRRFVYKGFAPKSTGLAVPAQVKDKIFASAYPDVAAGYASGGGLLMKLPTPKHSIFTPHLSSISQRTRGEAARKVRAGEPVERMAGRSAAGDRPYYETVMTGLDPKKALGFYSVGGKAGPLGGLMLTPLRAGREVVKRQPYARDLLERRLMNF